MLICWGLINQNQVMATLMHSILVVGYISVRHLDAVPIRSAAAVSSMHLLHFSASDGPSNLPRWRLQPLRARVPSTHSIRTSRFSMSTEDTLISRADALHAANKPEELFSLLQGLGAVDSEAMAWRLARCHHDLAEENANNPAKREKLLRDGLDIAETALKASPDSGQLKKWTAIILGRLGDFLPTKEKVANSYRIKQVPVHTFRRRRTPLSFGHFYGQMILKRYPLDSASVSAHL